MIANRERPRRGPRAVWRCSGLWLLVLLALAAGCGQAPVDPSPSAEAEARPLLDPSALPELPEPVRQALAVDTPVIAWVSHGEGRLEPCGCVAGMHGGLLRRGSLLSRAGDGPLLLLENGGWTGGDADYQRLRTQTYLAGLQRLGVAAIGIGASDVRRGIDVLRGSIDDLADELPLVSANVRCQSGATPWRQSRHISLGDHSFLITSVSPAASGDGLQVIDAAEALLPLVRTEGGRTPIVVLADLDADGLRRLADAVPGLACIIGGAVDQPSPRPLRVGPCRIIHVANHGKTLGWWPWGADACAFELIEDRIPDHPRILELVRDYQMELGRRDLTIDDQVEGLTTLRTGQATQRRYVGDQQCLACHQQAHRVHSASRHSHAYDTLVERGYQFDPDCLRCHVTGLGKPDGFDRLEPQPHLGRVSCESCHGRGSEHVAERSAGKPASGSLRIVTPASCVHCHDDENSPHFAYDSYWERIHHGLD